VFFQFSLSLNFDRLTYTSSSDRGKRMSDFSKRVAASIRDAEKQHEKTREQMNAANAAFAEKQRLKAKLSEEFWHKFKAIIVAKCKEVNEEVGKEYYVVQDSLSNKLQVTQSSPSASLMLTYIENGYRIRYDVRTNVGDYLIGIDENTGHAILLDAADSRELALEPTAEFLLEDILAKAGV
jgi:hypothetical protein